jgi:thiamine biosynthesis lipoprotein
MTCVTDPPTCELTARTVRAIGTTATVLVQNPLGADEAEWLLSDELRRIDEACSRFRADAELQRVHAAAGQPIAVSPLLFEALETACAVARRTRGAVDPTVGNAIAALGYDRDIDEVLARAPQPSRVLGPVAGYAHVQLCRESLTVRIPRGVRLDLGSSAKALVADRAAARIARELRDGVLVSVGGDVAVAGRAPLGGWAVGIAPESSTPADRVDQVVAIAHGGLASSATSVRCWRADDREVHHIVDPASGDCVEPYWRLVSAVGASCVDANALTTAAMVWGADALDHLKPFGQAMRLVRHDGQVVVLNGWPEGGQP